MPSKKEVIAELVQRVRTFPGCGPSDDPDNQTAFTVAYRHMLIQIQRLAGPLLPHTVAARLDRLDIDVNDIFSAYNVRAELHAMLPDLDDALASFDEALLVALGLSANIVDPALIARLERIKSKHADTGFLVRMCGEINSSHSHGNVLATVLLMRAVLNHVPPIFGVGTFEQVVANSGKSQRENFEHLESGLRKIADFHTHRKIAPVETYLSPNQVEPYKPQFEMLLHEIEATLRDELRLKSPVKAKPTDTPRAKGQKGDDDELFAWQLRHEVVAVQICRINPHYQVQYPDKVTRIIYTDLFPDHQLRKVIESEIVEPDRTYTTFTRRKPMPHEFRSPTLRETITKVEAALERFSKEHPLVARHLTGIN